MTQAIVKLADQSDNGGVVTEKTGDPSANGACAIIFRIVIDYQKSFGGHFDSLPFMTSGGNFIQGASLRSAKSGCEIWSRLEWDICRCQRRPQDRYDEQVRVVAARGSLAGYPYYIETESGDAYSGRVDSHGLLPRIATDVAQRYTVYWGDEALAHEEQQ
jgi:hypothetical protein